MKNGNELSQKNCFIANLSYLMDYFDCSSMELFWALVDIDEINYRHHKLDWVTCYLSNLELYDKTLWIDHKINNLSQVYSVFGMKDSMPNLIATQMDNIRYRNDIGNHLFPNVQHALLIHSGENILIEDYTLGSFGNIFSKTELIAQHFLFPFHII